MALFFWFDHSLGARAEICQIFSLVKTLFWNYLTFSMLCCSLDFLDLQINNGIVKFLLDNNICLLLLKWGFIQENFSVKVTQVKEIFRIAIHCYQIIGTISWQIFPVSYFCHLYRITYNFQDHSRIKTWQIH